jgi:hypothetical protein
METLSLVRPLLPAGFGGTKHFRGCGQEKVAKIDRCGEHLYLNDREATREVASSFL